MPQRYAESTALGLAFIRMEGGETIVGIEDCDVINLLAPSPL